MSKVGPRFHLNPYLVYASSEGSDETTQMHRLVRALAAQPCDKNQTIVCWPIYCYDVIVFLLFQFVMDYGTICLLTSPLHLKRATPE